MNPPFEHLLLLFFVFSVCLHSAVTCVSLLVARSCIQMPTKAQGIHRKLRDPVFLFVIFTEITVTNEDLKRLCQEFTVY